jgi:hypothetical protein
MVESNAYVPTNRERHPKKCDYLFLCVLRRPERTAYRKLDMVLLRDPEFTPRLRAKFDA